MAIVTFDYASALKTKPRPSASIGTPAFLPDGTRSRPGSGLWYHLVVMLPLPRRGGGDGNRSASQHDNTLRFPLPPPSLSLPSAACGYDRGHWGITSPLSFSATRYVPFAHGLTRGSAEIPGLAACRSRLPFPRPPCRHRRAYFGTGRAGPRFLYCSGPETTRTVFLSRVQSRSVRAPALLAEC